MINNLISITIKKTRIIPSCFAVFQQNDGQFPVIQLVGMLRGIASGMRYWHTNTHFSAENLFFFLGKVMGGGITFSQPSVNLERGKVLSVSVLSHWDFICWYFILSDRGQQQLEILFPALLFCTHTHTYTQNKLFCFLYTKQIFVFKAAQLVGFCSLKSYKYTNTLTNKILSVFYCGVCDNTQACTYRRILNPSPVLLKVAASDNSHINRDTHTLNSIIVPDR